METVKMKATADLARFVANCQQRIVTEKDEQQVRRILVDYFCAVVTGAQTETSKLLRHYLIENEGTGARTVIGTDVTLSAANAAFANATSAHCLDFDDGHTHGSIHPAAPIIPAILAVAEERSSTPEQVVRAIIVGYEVTLRIAATTHPHSRKRGFHNTPIAGIFGAAASVCSLYEASVETIESALGVAASFAGGLFAFLGTGSEVKRLHPGQAARDGVHAAKLAIAGLHGPKGVLEGDNGFFEAFAGKINEQRFYDQLGEALEIHNIYFKPYPCCRHLHVVIDAITLLKERHNIKMDDIASVHIGVNQIAAMHNHTECNTLLDAQMSLPYASVLALLHDGLQVDLFQPAKTRAAVAPHLQKLHIYVHDQADHMYPNYRAADVKIETTAGETFDVFVDNPLGEPTTPLSDAQIAQKFIVNCAPILGEQQATARVEALLNGDLCATTLFDWRDAL